MPGSVLGVLMISRLLPLPPALGGRLKFRFRVLANVLLERHVGGVVVPA
jgi:hypothetical protein